MDLPCWQLPFGRDRHAAADDDGDAVGPVHQPRRLLHPDVQGLQQVHDQVLRQGGKLGKGAKWALGNNLLQYEDDDH